MNTTLYTTEYDLILQRMLPHLQNYPVMLPHIGSRYNDAPARILLIGESHYIPKADYSPAHIADWYSNTSTGLNGYLSGYINTRQVVERADKREKFQKGLTIFYNIKSALKQNVNFLKDEELIFPHLSYYNFFQRPAFEEGASIISTEQDNTIAYETFKLLLSLIKPGTVVFTSKKAFNCFNWLQHSRKETALFEPFKIDNVPHPASAWWNRKSRQVTINGTAVTGKEKFIHLMKSLEL